MPKRKNKQDAEDAARALTEPGSVPWEKQEEIRRLTKKLLKEKRRSINLAEKISEAHAEQQKAYYAKDGNTAYAEACNKISYLSGLIYATDAEIEILSRKLERAKK